MNHLEIIVAIAAGIILFLFGIEHFSKEIQAITGQKFRRFLARGTRNRLVAVLLGGSITAIIQSSTATSVIAVGLVNAGVLSFRQALGILFGANVGTTMTAQLVALKLTDFAPALILIGFAAGFLPFRWRILNRAIFYFGLVFFSLNLVSAAVAPLKSNPEIIEFLASVSGPAAGVLAGAAFTAVVQSSSVTTGIAIILLEQGVINFGLALPLVLGANVGTTATALLASARLDTSARRTALSHALYNVGGVLLVFPWLGTFGDLLLRLGQSPTTTLATAHLVFNVLTALVFVAAMHPFAQLVERMIPDDAEERPLPPPPALQDVALDEALGAAEAWLQHVSARIAPCYTAIALMLQTRDDKIRSRAARQLSIIRFGITEGEDLVHGLSKNELSEQTSRRVLDAVITLDHIRQLVDSLDDLMDIDESLSRRHSRFSMDALLDIQRIYPAAGTMLEALSGAGASKEALSALRDKERELGRTLNDCYLRFLDLVRREREGSELGDLLSIHQRLRSKVVAFAKHMRAHAAAEENAPGARAATPAHAGIAPEGVAT